MKGIRVELHVENNEQARFMHIIGELDDWLTDNNGKPSAIADCIRRARRDLVRAYNLSADPPKVRKTTPNQ